MDLKLWKDGLLLGTFLSSDCKIGIDKQECILYTLN